MISRPAMASTHSPGWAASTRCCAPGVSVFKTFETTNGSITPLVDVSYLDAMDGDSTLSSNGIVFGNDTSGSGYRAELGVAGRYKDPFSAAMESLLKRSTALRRRK